MLKLLSVDNTPKNIENSENSRAMMGDTGAQKKRIIPPPSKITKKSGIIESYLKLNSLRLKGVVMKHQQMRQNMQEQNQIYLRQKKNLL